MSTRTTMMVAKILLPLLLVASAVAGDAVPELCQQLTSQINMLQRLVPLESDVYFRRTPQFQNGYINGPAKFRHISPLVNTACSSSANGDSKTTRINIGMEGDTAFVISPSRVLVLNKPTYTLLLEVKRSDDEDTKTITVVDFNFTIRSGTEDTLYITPLHLNYIRMGLADILKKKIQHDLRTTFKTDTRVEINNKLIRDLMINIFQVTAQDF